MPIRLRRPGEAELRALLHDCRGHELTYSPVGLTEVAVVPAGYRRDRWERGLGRGDDVFDAAVRALTEWAVHSGAGLTVVADGPPAFGVVVAMSAPLAVVHVDATCRVVSVAREADRFGFAYGTLPVHPVQGEESFHVERDGDGRVTFRVVAVSRPHHALTRLCPPLATRLQRAGTERYLDAMVAAVA